MKKGFGLTFVLYLVARHRHTRPATYTVVLAKRGLPNIAAWAMGTVTCIRADTSHNTH